MARIEKTPDPKGPHYSVLNKFVAGNEVEREPLRDFAKGEIFFQGLRLIGSGTGLRRLLIAAETARTRTQISSPRLAGPKPSGEGD